MEQWQPHQGRPRATEYAKFIDKLNTSPTKLPAMVFAAVETIIIDENNHQILLHDAGYPSGSHVRRLVYEGETPRIAAETALREQMGIPTTHLRLLLKDKDWRTVPPIDAMPEGTLGIVVKRFVFQLTSTAYELGLHKNPRVIWRSIETLD
ncbi:MAG: hypothetical protein H0W86_00110 [Armatimonadetes bacterium]|nr:hypothetical protein [Armatimonadota bacterium]